MLFPSSPVPMRDSILKAFIDLRLEAPMGLEIVLAWLLGSYPIDLSQVVYKPIKRYWGVERLAFEDLRECKIPILNSFFETSILFELPGVFPGLCDVAMGQAGIYLRPWPNDGLWAFDQRNPALHPILACPTIYTLLFFHHYQGKVTWYPVHGLVGIQPDDIPTEPAFIPFEFMDGVDQRVGNLERDWLRFWLFVMFYGFHSMKRENAFLHSYPSSDFNEQPNCYQALFPQNNKGEMMGTLG